MYFIREISLFRIQNNISEEIWLILDGHKSRINTMAIELFVRNKINVLFLPSHCSHVCQPFDVGLASPFKRRIKDFSQNPPNYIREMIFNAPSQATQQRIHVVSSIINSWTQTATHSNCYSSFYACGIFPYDISKVLSNRFVRTSDQNDGVPVERGISINSQVITADSKRIEIASNFFGVQINNVAQIPQYDEASLIQWLQQDSDVILQDFPCTFLEALPNIIIRQ